MIIVCLPPPLFTPSFPLPLSSLLYSLLPPSPSLHSLLPPPPLPSFSFPPKEYARMVQMLQGYCLICTGVRITCQDQSGKGYATTCKIGSFPEKIFFIYSVLLLLSFSVSPPFSASPPPPPPNTHTLLQSETAGGLHWREFLRQREHHQCVRTKTGTINNLNPYMEFTNNNFVVSSL